MGGENPKTYEELGRALFETGQDPKIRFYETFRKIKDVLTEGLFLFFGNSPDIPLTEIDKILSSDYKYYMEESRG